MEWMGRLTTFIVNIRNFNMDEFKDIYWLQKDFLIEDFYVTIADAGIWCLKFLYDF